MKIIPKFDLETIQSIIAGDFPNLQIETVKIIESWDNVVAEINSRYIFRFPKDADVSKYRGMGKSFDREISILNYLKDKITLEIPKIEFLGKTFTYMGYKKIPGNDLTQEIFDSLNSEQKEKLIFDLANFLQEIHNALSVKDARKMSVEDENSLNLLSYLNTAKKILQQKIDDQQIVNFTNKTCDEYEKMLEEKTELVFLYNDLHTENIAFDYVAKRLNGVFDFGDVLIGDVNMDLYPLYKFDPYFMKDVAEKYQQLTGRKLSLRRMVIYGRINELCDLVEFINIPESTVYKNAIMRIKKWNSEMEMFK